jgi:hypothetical protein
MQTQPYREPISCIAILAETPVLHTCVRRTMYVIRFPWQKTYFSPGMPTTVPTWNKGQ